MILLMRDDINVVLENVLFRLPWGASAVKTCIMHIYV